MLHSPVIIRETQKEDLPDIIRLYQSLESSNIKEECSGELIEQFEHFKNYPYHKIFTALIDDKIIGTFTLSILKYLCHQGKSAGVMEAVVFDKAYRSQGAGREMIAFALAECKKNNCYKMSLSSNVVRERAHAFYEREGFKLHGYSLYTEIYPE